MKFFSCHRFPPFTEAVAFGKDCKKQGIACHHPKFLVLQREDSIRVIITSANLVAKQVILKDLSFTSCSDHVKLILNYQPENITAK